MGEVSTRATGTSSPAPLPGDSTPSLPPSLEVLQAAQDAGTSLALLASCKPRDLPPHHARKPPQKANSSLALELPCFPTHFQINRECQMLCPAHQLGP